MINFKRLEDLAAILEQVKYYNQEIFASCGTPLCALGHWCAAHPERWRFENDCPVRAKGDSSRMSLWEHVKEEFGITSKDCILLFGTTGCGGAKNAFDASAYIRDFIKERKGVKGWRMVENLNGTLDNVVDRDF